MRKILIILLAIVISSGFTLQVQASPPQQAGLNWEAFAEIKLNHVGGPQSEKIYYLKNQTYFTQMGSVLVIIVPVYSDGKGMMDVKFNYGQTSGWEVSVNGSWSPVGGGSIFHQLLRTLKKNFPGQLENCGI